ncbi:RING-H2 finger protein ATL8-like [Miscanthus floridulus]|uniref:RING-H2 finger protein ATL8-like n=1 Tax=Miscanthus floridulus TaxID=154761 RepID=UPI0034576339
MASPARRLLQTNSAQYPTLPAAEPPSPLAVDSDVVVILAALLCVVGLAAAARCARSRAAPSTAQAAARRGLKKKALRALPSLAYEDAVAAAAAGAGEAKVLAECAICLSEFTPREEVRVLPQCGHAFHVACIDTWLAAHSSCPSCRRVLVVADAADKRPPQPKRCRKCEAAMDEEASSSSGSGGDTAAGS